MSYSAAQPPKTYYQVIVVGADISDYSLYASKSDAALAAARIVRTAPAGVIVSVKIKHDA
jgi:hypothetical protein